MIILKSVCNIADCTALKCGITIAERNFVNTNCTIRNNTIIKKIINSSRSNCKKITRDNVQL